MDHLAPIFIVGAARSGTTLLSTIISAHSLVAIPYESYFLIQYYPRRQDYDFTSDREKRRLLKSILAERIMRRWDEPIGVDDVNLDQCHSFRDVVAGIFSAYARKKGKPIWGDKTPGYTDQLHIVTDLFPEARVVHVLRDGRDVALSHMKTTWGRQDLVSGLRYWKDIVSVGRKLGRMMSPSSYYEVFYERLCADPVEVANDVCNFLGIEFEPAMIATGRSHAKATVPKALLTGQHALLSKPPQASNTLKWKSVLDDCDQAIAHEIAGDLLEELGYEPGCKEVGTWRRRLRLATWYWKRRRGWTAASRKDRRWTIFF